MADEGLDLSTENNRLLFHGYLDGHLADRRQHRQWAAIAYMALGHSRTLAEGFNLAGRGIAQLKRWQKRWPESMFKPAAE